jgi:hypothetical protein
LDARGAKERKAGKSVLPQSSAFVAGESPAIITSAPVHFRSSFREMNGIRIISAVASGPSATVVNHFEFLIWILDQR